MTDLRSVAQFFRCSLTQAVRFTTDQEILCRFNEWTTSILFERPSPW
jgi:hypothetical protein